MQAGAFGHSIMQARIARMGNNFLIIAVDNFCIFIFTKIILWSGIKSTALQKVSYHFILP